MKASESTGQEVTEKANAEEKAENQNEPQQNQSSNPIDKPNADTVKAKSTNESKDFRKGDWNCKMCKGHNFASRNKCYKCHAPREPPRDFKMGDWICPLCTAHNYRSKRSCFQCHRGKPFFEGRNGMRPGDWMCPGCGAHNFKDKINCFNCTMRKPFLTHLWDYNYLPSNFKPGDWLCNCGGHNYQSRSACYKCNSDRPPQGMIQPSSQANQQPDQFQQRQFAPQMSQMMLQYPTVHQIQTLMAQASLGPRLPPNFRPGDWLCVACMAHNYRSRDTCFRCSTPKPKPEGGSQEQPQNQSLAPQSAPIQGPIQAQMPGQIQPQLRSMAMMQAQYPMVQSLIPGHQQARPIMRPLCVR